MTAKKTLIGSTASSAGGDRPAADRERLRGRLHERVRLLDVVTADERGDDGAVRGREVARRRREREGGEHEPPDREVPRQAADRDRNEHDAAREVGGDHELPAIPAVGGEAAVEAEDERRHAVGEPDGDDAERAARVEREPHQRDVVERVPELARCDRREEAAEVPAVEQRERAFAARRRQLELELFGDGANGVGHRASVPGTRG